MKAPLLLGSFLLSMCCMAVSPRGKHQRFVENKGQWPGSVSYRAEFGMASLFIGREGLTWSMLQADAGERMHDLLHAEAGTPTSYELHGHAWRMRFVEANADVAISSSDRSTTYLNYFLGNDPGKWVGHVGVFGEVRYAGVWNGVDLRLRAAEGGFKYDVLLAAGADAGKVRFAYEGLDALSTDKDGKLVLRTSLGELVEMAPVAYYADGGKEPVGCVFNVRGTTVGFTLAEGTDRERPIVIDPLLVASTLSGTGDIGTTQNYGFSATYDPLGNIYTGAICFGQGYPVTTGAFSTIYNGGSADVSISKLNPDGSDLIYATYLGGSEGEYPHTLLVSEQDELVVFGVTSSSDFPTGTGAFDPSYNGDSDFTVTKFSQDGSAIVGSTYMGSAGYESMLSMGPGGGGDAFTDEIGNVYCVSGTGSGFPTTPGAYQPAFGGGEFDGVVFCLNNDLTLLNWSTYLGSTNDEICSGLARDAQGDIYLIGSTRSSGFPTTPGTFQQALSGGADAYVAKLSGDGSALLYGTFFGTDMDDYGCFIQLDINGDVFVHGTTGGAIPIQPVGTYGLEGAMMFVAKFTPDLAANPMSTVVGVPGGVLNYLTVAFLVDDCGHLYLSGYLGDPSLPITSDALQTSGGFYLSAYEADMSELLFGSFYGGSQDHVDGGTSRFDKSGVIYQGVCTGGDFPTTPWAFSGTQPSGYDMAVFKIDFQLSDMGVGITASATTGCAPATIDFGSTGTALTQQWTFGDGTALDTAASSTHTFTDAGTYMVTLVGFDPEACIPTDTATITIVISDPEPPEPAFTATQAGGCDPYTIVTVNSSVGQASTFLWDMGDGSTYPTTDVTHAYAGAGTFTITLTVTDTVCGTAASVSRTITVTGPVAVNALFSLGPTDPCTGLNVSTINSSSGPDGMLYTWDMGDSTTLLTENVVYTYIEAGSYTITLTAYDPFCDEEDTFELPVLVQASSQGIEAIIPPNVFSPNNDGENDTFFPIGDANDHVRLTVWNRWGLKMFETEGPYRPWDGRSPDREPVPDGVYYYRLDYSIPCAGQSVEGKESGFVHVLGSRQ